MNTTNISNSFNFVNDQFLKLSKGQVSFCDYDSFEQMMEMWIVPDHVSPDEVEQFMSDFCSYLQYQFEDELGDIYGDLKLIARYIEKNAPNYESMSSNEVLEDLMKFGISFQNICESTLNNIRLELNERECFSNLEI